MLFDGSGAEYHGTIEDVSRNDVWIKINRKYLPQIESPLRLILFQGIPKSDKMDMIVKGTTELGIHTIIPFFSSRSIPRWGNESMTRKVEHWEKIATEAARQSGRTRVPEVNNPLSFEEMVKEVNYLNKDMIKIILWEEEREGRMKKVLKEQDKVSGISCIIGPEGGFSPEEVNLLKGAGCISINLGKRILRSETAAIALISIIQYEWGDLCS